MLKIIVMKKCLGLLFIVWLSCQTAFGQALTVYGKVRSLPDRRPLPNVLVAAPENNASTVSDSLGRYSITVPFGAPLVFSFSGYQTHRVEVIHDTMNIVMVISELIPIGYGSAEKSHVTGAVGDLPASGFNEGMLSAPEQLLQGRLAGVQVQANSGEPGANIHAFIRGLSSVNGNAPLVVVDGFPLTDYSPYPEAISLGHGTAPGRNGLNFLNPDDIETITVLKDAASAAIYGARAANGVLLISTKNGSGKRQQFDFSSAAGVASFHNPYPLLNAREFLRNQSLLSGSSDFLNAGADTDWQHAISRNAVVQQQYLSYGHQHATGTYNASLGYDNQQGIIKNSGFERISGKLNLQQHLLADRLKLNADYLFSRINDEASPITNNAGFTGDLLSGAYMANPTWPADPTFQESNPLANPLSLLEYTADNTRTNSNLLNLSLDYALADELHLHTRWGANRVFSSRQAAYSPELFFVNGVFANGRAYQHTLTTNSRLFDAWLAYDKAVGIGQLRAIAGYGYQQFEREGSLVQGWGFGTSDLSAMSADLDQSAGILRNSISRSYAQMGFHQNGFFINRLSPVQTVPFTTAPEVPGRSVTESVYGESEDLRSVFGRLQYADFHNFTVNTSFRLDAASRFGASYPYGFFPSAGLAYQLSNLDFMPEVIDRLSLRGAWGSVGNQPLSHNASTMSTQYEPISINNDGFINIPAPMSINNNNDNLRWERTSEINFGIDYSIAKGRLQGGLDVYRRQTTDLLLMLPAPQPSNQPFQLSNSDAVILNQGVELHLHYIAVKSSQTQLSFGFNMAYNQNELQQFDGIIETGVLHGQGLTGAYAQRMVEGQPLYSYFLREFIDYDADGMAVYDHFTPALQEGKSALPRYNFGFSSMLSHKAWELSAWMYAQTGHYIYNNTANAFFGLGNLRNGRNVPANTLENNESANNAPESSTLFLERGDFLRLQNLELAYNFKLDNSKIKALRLHLSGQNLWLLTDYSGQDPEVHVSKPMNGTPSLGIDYTAYPRPRTVMLGLNARF